MPVIGVLLALLGQVLPGAPLPGQTGPATITGTITVAGSNDATVLAGLVVVAVPDNAEDRTGPLAPARLRRVEPGDGRFELGDLPPGTYRVTAADASALDDWPDPDLLAQLAGRGIPVPVTPGERVDIEIVVSPEPGIRRVTGGRMAVTRAMVTGGAGPGPRLGAPGANAARSGGAPPRPAGRSSIRGRVLADGQAASGVAVSAMRWLTRNGVREPVRSGQQTKSGLDGSYELTGLFAGEYFVAAFADGTDPEAARSSSALTTTFHPSAVSTAEANTVVVGEEDVATDVDIEMRRVAAAVLSGRFVDPSGAAVIVRTVALVPVVAEERMGGANTRTTAAAADGSFRFEGVPFGEYLLRSLGSLQSWSPAHVRVSAGMPEAQEFRVEPAAVVSGRLEFAGPAPAPASLDGFFVVISETPLMTGAGRLRLPVGADGTFSGPAATGVSYQIDAEAPEPWRLVNGFFGTQDTQARPFTLVGPRDDLRVVLASVDTTVSVLVFDDEGRPFEGGRAVIFPVSPALRRGGSAYISLGRLVGGRFTASLPPGEYFIAAGAHIAPEGRISMGALIPLEEEATRFSLELGEAKALSVTVRRRD